VSLKDRISKILGRNDFDVLEIDPKSILLEVSRGTSDNNIVSSDIITADKVRAWLKTLPEPTFEEMQDYLWHERS